MSETLSPPVAEDYWNEFSLAHSSASAELGGVPEGVVHLAGEVATNSQISGFGEQLELGYSSGKALRLAGQTGDTSNASSESKYIHPPDMSPLEEARYVQGYIQHEKAHKAWTLGEIDYDEFNARVADTTPKTYQRPLLKQNGELFREEEPPILDPKIGAGVEDGTFWHVSNQEMEPGDRLLPAGEIPDSIHQANTSDRNFVSSSSRADLGAIYGKEQDFAVGTRRAEGPHQRYGSNVYKVHSPNASVVHTVNGPEVWAEGGGTVVQRMNPDFGVNYSYLRDKIMATDNYDQPAMPGMEVATQYIPESELNDLSHEEFREKYLRKNEEIFAPPIDAHVPGPDDVTLPGMEDRSGFVRVPRGVNRESIM